MMWISRGDRRFWVGRHREVGVVVYDPYRGDAPHGSADLFGVETDSFQQFAREDLRSRDVWGRLDVVDAELAVNAYLDRIWKGWLTRSKLEELRRPREVARVVWGGFR